MTRASDLPGMHQLTPGAVADGERAGDIVGNGMYGQDVHALIDGLYAARKLNQATANAEVTGPGDVDSHQLEDERRRHFWLATGRVPTVTEIAGAMRPDCIVCQREGWVCGEHRRREGDPLPQPPAGERNGCRACSRLEWPCPAHSGAMPVHHPAPYNLLKSVG